ncbi:MAG: efflux RND transporter periplasmic adaptor subunit [Sulfurimonas sp.]|uniref:efflux RND transporter periplasmic adaptor subunit n=1 Tax=Sulfurimonas sp. TaxID=2022749 RepID=UPI0028CEFF06|nr:efflux RND transporter periplasmic adaptor subunit [Sulfurimonas sp.]MDT8338470.1 efflux RND transporter periplasmic adaptor subunit [Sulfurimonas sp.]
MKKIIMAQIVFALSLTADVTLTPQEEKSWQIQSAKAKEVTYVPLDTYMMQVTTPPTLLHTISVPYEAQVVQLHKTEFEHAKKGEVLATLSSQNWIEAQKEAIDTWIELSYSKDEANRRSQLCKEEIIAQKECFVADEEMKRDTIKLQAAKALLRSYGATDEVMQKLFNELTIFSNIELRSSVKGVVLQTDIQVGKNISPSSALFVIKTEGENWLEADIPQAVVKTLQPSQEVILRVGKDEIKSKILLISPTLHPLNQTRYVRFVLPKDANLLAGLRTKVELSVAKRAFVIDKKALIRQDNESIVFIKKGQTYSALRVDVLAENREVCYLEYKEELKEPIAVTATSILQNRLNEEK